MPPSRLYLVAIVFTAASVGRLKAQQVALSSPGSWSREGFQVGALSASGTMTTGPNLKHTLQIGRTGLDLSLADELEYSDNVRVEQQGREGMSNTFSLSFDSAWAPTKVQDIALSGSVGSRVPLYGPGKGHALWNIAPNTAVKMNIYVDQLRITPFVRVSRSLDPVAATVVSETETFTQTIKDAGIVADYPLYKTNLQLVVLAGAKRAAADNTPPLTTERFSTGLRGTRSFAPGAAIGIDTVAFTQTYRNGPAEKSDGQGASVFVRWPISNLISGQFSTGWDVQRFTQSKDPTDNRRTSEPFMMVSLSHRANSLLNYMASVRRAVFDGVSTNYFRSTEYALSPTYSVNQSVAVTTAIAYKTSDESTRAGDHGHSLIGSISASYTSKGGTSLSLGCNYADKKSSIAKREYTQSRFSFAVFRKL